MFIFAREIILVSGREILENTIAGSGRVKKD
jgi:hypothetical protein